MRFWVILLLCLFCSPLVAADKPLMRDFIGLNVHTVQFKPDLYRPVVSQIRDYHPIHWDLADQTSTLPPFPLAKNRVNWQELYGTWHQKGYGIDVCLMESGLKPENWNDLEKDLSGYGETFARQFGSRGLDVAASAEIFNEPASYDDATYKKAFIAAARGIRAGDKSMRIATCNVHVEASGEYHKSVELFANIPELYDILSTHIYAQKEPWPTWRRSYPEDPSIAYLNQLKDLIAWRNTHAPDKAIWVTEFGWDASTRKPDPKGPNAQWVGVSDLQQAQYLVRSLLVFSSMEVEKAFIYFFNDDDEPSVHAAAGLTRKFVPKPSFYAIAQMQRILGNCRLIGFHQSQENLSAIYQDATRPRRQVHVLWRATADDKVIETTLPTYSDGVTLVSVEPMATSQEAPPATRTTTLPLSASPVYAEYDVEPHPMPWDK